VVYDRVVAGRLVTPGGILEDGWLAIAGEAIAAVGQGPRPEALATAEFGRAYVLPGAIDGQTHAGSQTGFPGLGPTSRAAVRGGVTTIVDMPYDEPSPITDGAILSEKIAGVHRYAVSDVALYGTVTTSPDPRHIDELIAGGVCAFKISAFESHPTRFPRIDNGLTRWLLEKLAGTGLPLGLHNEDQEIVRATIQRFIAEGRTDAVEHSASRPEVAELAATATFLELARGLDAHAHIVHISTPDGFDLVGREAAAGIHATAEMCLHYLHFDGDTDMRRLGGLLKVNPPIRPGRREALWQVLEAGGATFVSSDHSAWPLSRKADPNIFNVAAGMPGLEVLLPAFVTDAAARRSLDGAVQWAAKLLGEAPARFFGLSRKGRLAPGMDADFAVLDPTPFAYSSSANPDGPGWSAYDGETYAVTPIASFVRGRLAWDGATIVAEPGSGRFVPRG